MGTNTLSLGPWPKGVSFTSNRDLSVFMDKDELGEAKNVVLTQEGFIEPRPGCKTVISNTLYTNIGANGVIDILGSIQLPTGAVVTFVQVTNGTQSYVYLVRSLTSITLYFTPPANTRFTHVLMHSGITGHTGIIFFANQDSKSYVTTDYTLIATPSLIASAIPGSDTGIIVKDRLFLIKRDTSKFMWSPATYIFDWSGVPGAATANGDDISGYEFVDPTTESDGIMSFEFINNNFYLFKKNRTFLFTYQTTPVSDGFLRKLSDDFGAYDSILYKNTVIVFNGKGVFRVDNTEFIDLQPQLNLRFEFPLDHNAVTPNDVFIAVLNNDIVIGFRDLYSGAAASELVWKDTWSDTYESFAYFGPQAYYYCLNGYSAGWTEWTFEYNKTGAVEEDVIASPGSNMYLLQPEGSTDQILLTTTFKKDRLNYFELKPKTFGAPSTYHLDTENSYAVLSRYYIPAVSIKTRASIGGSMLKFKKLYRTFLRFYLSDLLKSPIVSDSQKLWTFSLNHNDYRFSHDTENSGNILFYLYPEKYDPANPVIVLPNSTTDIYRRTYQLPVPQQRVVEFVVELKRTFSVVLTDQLISNPDSDRPVKRGYYFALSGIWFDYLDKAEI